MNIQVLHARFLEQAPGVFCTWGTQQIKHFLVVLLRGLPSKQIGISEEQIFWSANVIFLVGDHDDTWWSTRLLFFLHKMTRVSKTPQTLSSGSSCVQGYSVLCVEASLLLRKSPWITKKPCRTSGADKSFRRLPTISPELFHNEKKRPWGCENCSK